jgi:phage terminase large subunit-like protein
MQQRTSSLASVKSPGTSGRAKASAKRRPVRRDNAPVELVLPSGLPPEFAGKTRPIGKYERLAYERQERDLRAAYGERWNDPTAYADSTRVINKETGETWPGIPTEHPKGFYYDIGAAERGVKFTERFCRHHKGEWSGKALTLEEWQKFTRRVTYGWMNADGSRRFRISYREVPRKNGKTEEAASEGTYLQTADQEPGAEVYSIATKEDQAAIVWSAAKAMVEMSPDLRKWITPRQKYLECKRLRSVFRPLGADSDTQDGLNPSGVIADEMHAHKKRGMWDVMITGMGARRQPLIIVITTAGVYDPVSIGWELHLKAMQVLEGVVEDDTFFAIIFAADEGDDWRDPMTWWKANPNLGVSVKFKYMLDQAAMAETQPSFLNTFQRLHLNIWTQQVTRWISVEKWKACDQALQPWDAYKGRLAFLALDLSSKKDISCLAIDFPMEHGFHDFFWKFYVPEALVKERARRGDKPDYASWAADGHMTVTPGGSVDYAFIRRDILAIRQQVSVRQLAYDPWNANQFQTQLQGDGFSVDPDAVKEQLVEVRQGYASMSEASKEFERLTIDAKIRHGANPVMLWMVNNAVIRRDANDNIAPDKAAATGRIDGLVASIMTLSRSMVVPAATKSIYEQRGVRNFG